MNKFLLAAAAFAMALSANPADAKKAADGYTFSVKDMNNKALEVHIIEYASYPEMTAAWVKADPRRIPDGRHLAAFSQLDTNPNAPLRYCVIHIINPLIEYNPESVGHELMHCIYGNFHPVEVEK